jgi:nucleotide-binding universal stress UspA family protein
MKTPALRLVCATDFSAGAEQAAAVAATLAARRGARLELVHVTAARAVAPVRARLRHAAAGLQLAGATVEPVLLQSYPPAHALLAHLAAQPPALVVVASTAKGFIDRWAFGSVAEEIAESAHAPTLVVQDAAPFRHWDWTGDRLRVLVAVDRFAGSDVVLRWVKELRQFGPCDLVTCQITWTPRPPGRDAGATGAALAAAAQTRLERDLRKKVRDLLGDESGESLVRATWGTTDAAILEIARETRADLIVVGTHQRHGVGRLLAGSVSRSLLHQPGRNVVCVPHTTALDPADAHIPEYRRVLVATDFSALGDAAIPFACAATAVGGEVRLLHVTAPTRSAARLARLRARLAALVPDEIRQRAQTVRCEVVTGRNPARVICAEAERGGADLVCLASHGLSGSRAVFGSVTTGVLRHLRRPFLVVRRPED